MAGILRDLEQYRLARHDKAALRTTGALIGELLGLRILPGAVADMLAVFRDDLDTAIAAKEESGQAAGARQAESRGAPDPVQPELTV